MNKKTTLVIITLLYVHNVYPLNFMTMFLIFNSNNVNRNTNQPCFLRGSNPTSNASDDNFYEKTDEIITNNQEPLDKRMKEAIENFNKNPNDVFENEEDQEEFKKYLDSQK